MIKSKKIMSILAAMAMIVGLTVNPVTVNASSIQSSNTTVETVALPLEVTTEDIIITEDTVWDLQGKTYELKDGACIRVESGTLTVKNGTINADIDAFYVVSKGNAVLNLESDVNVTARDCCVVLKNQGAVLNTEANLVSTSGDYAPIQGNGSAGGIKVNITGGTIKSEDVGVYFPSKTELNISGGTIEGKSAIYHKSGKLTISGGKFVANGSKAEYVHNGNGCNATGDALVIEACDYPDGVPVVDITGGTFISKNADAIGYYQQNESYKLANEKFVKGGTFSSLVTKYAADGAVVKLASDVTLSEDEVIDTAGKSITLDLNGKKLSVEKNAIIKLKNGNLTVKNGSIDAAVDAFYVESEGSAVLNLESDVNVTAGDCCVVLKKQGAVLNTEANLVSTSGNYAPIQGNGSAGGIKVNITGGTIKSEDVGVYFPSKTELNISGGKIEGKSAIYHKSGKLTISGGEFVAVGPKADYVHNGNGCNATGDALVIEACDYPDGVPVVSITGGKFTSANADAIGYYQQSEDYKLADEKFVTGGVFSSNPTEYVADGYKVLGTSEFEVVPVTEYVKLDKTEITLEAGKTFDLEATVTADGEVAWTISDDSVVEFDGSTFKAVAPGTAVITASMDGKTATCNVTVYKIEADSDVTTSEDSADVKEDTAGLVEDILASDDVTESDAVKDGVVSEDTAEAIKDAIVAGETITTTIVVDEISADSVSKEVQEAMEEAAAKEISEEAKLVYLDVEVLLMANGKELGTLNQLTDEIVITIEIPEEIRSKGYIYKVLRNHDGVITVLDTIVNEDGTLSFKTDCFSTYAIGYSEASASAPAIPQPEEPETPNNSTPDTGDTTSVMGYFVMLIAAATVVFMIGRRKEA